jgi:hypothetical protein
MERLVAQRLLKDLTLGDIPGVDHDTCDIGVVEKVRGYDLGPELRAVGMAGAEHDRLVRSWTRHNRGVPLPYRRQLFRRDKVDLGVER